MDLIEQWRPPDIPEHIPHGDMPGDKIYINSKCIEKATVIFRELWKHTNLVLHTNPNNKAVITVYGGSGAGKSTIASLLSFYFCRMGIESYTLSGDNYPHRIPKYNDAERLRVFREAGLKNMICEGEYTVERYSKLQTWQETGMDADPSYAEKYPWFASYLRGGRKGLEGYLGTDKEIGFEELSAVVKAFKSGKDDIWLRRMGRAESDLWYEKVDFSCVNILIIEWTHGNSDFYEGVDIPVFLDSTPKDTLIYRCARNRDDGADSPFTSLVLDIEQALLHSQTHKAKIILSKDGELLTYNAYEKLMTDALNVR